MPKPRDRWTALKHFGTILWHPQQYYRYKTHKNAFVQQDHLNLHPHYNAELAGPVHPYPGAAGATIRERGVIYPPAALPPALDAATRVVGNITAHAVHDHQAAAGVAPAQLGADRDTLVVLRQEAGGTVMRAAKKRGPHADVALPNVGRTQHTTLTGGQPVAAAAIFDPHVGVGVPAPRLVIASGHYQPGDNAAAKLAIFGKQTGTIARRSIDFVDQHNAPMHMNRFSIRKRPRSPRKFPWEKYAARLRRARARKRNSVDECVAHGKKLKWQASHENDRKSVS